MTTVRVTVALICVWLTSGCCRVDEVPKLTKQLDSVKASERNDAALALARCGAKADGAVPKLARLLYDENVGVQSAASYALRQIDTPAAREVMTRVEQRKVRR